jgi:hypothetical protein
MMRRPTSQTNHSPSHQPRPSKSTQAQGSTATINSMTSRRRVHRDTPHTTHSEESEIEVKGNNTYAEPKRKQTKRKSEVPAEDVSTSTNQIILQIPLSEKATSSSSGKKLVTQSASSVTELVRMEDERKKSEKYSQTNAPQSGTFIGEKNRVKITTPSETTGGPQVKQSKPRRK